MRVRLSAESADHRREVEPDTCLRQIDLNIRLRPKPGRRRRRFAQIAYVRPGNRRRLPGVAHQGCVPPVTRREDELIEQRRDAVEKPGVAGLPAGVVVGQFEEHRQVAEHDVLGPPRLGLGAEDEVLERRNRQCLETRVHAVRIRLQQRPLTGCGPLDHRSRQHAQPVEPPLPVEIRRGRAENRRQLARRGAAQQVHLKEAILSVDEAGRLGHVNPAAAAYGRHAVAVALDGHRSRKPGHPSFTIQLWQAAGCDPV